MSCPIRWTGCPLGNLPIPTATPGVVINVAAKDTWPQNVGSSAILVDDGGTWLTSAEASPDRTHPRRQPHGTPTLSRVVAGTPGHVPHVTIVDVWDTLGIVVSRIPRVRATSPGAVPTRETERFQAWLPNPRGSQFPGCSSAPWSPRRPTR